MKVSTGDYLVVSRESKRQVVRCVAAEGKSLVCAVGDNQVEFKTAEVLANLGRRPAEGSVFGLKIQPRTATLESPSKMWTGISVYNADIDETVQTRLTSELAAVTSALRKLGVGVLRCELEIRTPKGKALGGFKRGKEGIDTITVRPESNLENFHYMVAYQAANAVWSRLLVGSSKRDWILLYHKNVVLSSIDGEELDSLLDRAVTAQSITSLLKEATDDETLIVKAVVKHIGRVHGLSKQHLDQILECRDSIDGLWPTAIEVSSKGISISEQGMKSPEAFFAEAFAYAFLSRTVPKRVKSLLDTTLSKLRKA